MPRAVRSPTPTKPGTCSTRAPTRAPTREPTRALRAKDKVKDKRAVPWFDPSAQFLFISFATLNEGESHKTEGRRFSPFSRAVLAAKRAAGGTRPPGALTIRAAERKDRTANC